MLDPRVQQKGGFGAFAARQQERQDERAAAEAQAERDAATGPVAAVPGVDATALAAARSDVRRAEKILLRTSDGA
jgi:hypothetical protein